MPYSSTEIDARVQELGRRLRAADQATADPTVRVRRVDPELLRRPEPPRCEQCGTSLPNGPIHTCAARAAAPVVQLRAVRVRGRSAHLPTSARRGVLAWLAENGPATARQVAWALELDRREVQVFFRELDGKRVESVGKLVTGRRGVPPTVWRVRQEGAIAA